MKSSSRTSFLQTRPHPKKADRNIVNRMYNQLCNRLNNSGQFTGGSGRQLVATILRCVIAHKEVCKPDHTHRDINVGNILVCPTYGGVWTGVLNDWELAHGFTTEGVRRFDRTGTWQFASVHVLNAHSKITAIADDLESFFHVMLYLAICFLPHNATGVVCELLYHYFDEYTNAQPGETAGSTKFMAMQRGVIDITRYTGAKFGENGKLIDPYLTFLWPGRHSTNEPGAQVSSHPIQVLIRELLRWFKALYAQGINVETATVRVPTDRDDTVSGAAALALLGLGGIETTTPIPISFNTKTRTTNAEKQEQLERAQKLETHDAMVQLLLTCIKQLKWPGNDKGHDKGPKNVDSPPKGSIPPVSTNISSKRVMEDGAEPGSKRVRSEIGV